MKKIPLFVLMMITYGVHSQCLFNSESVGDPITIRLSTSGNSRLDRHIDEVIALFNSELELNTEYFFYDDSRSPNCFAHPGDANIYLGVNFLKSSLSKDPSLTGISFIIAHEMAHIYQFYDLSEDGNELLADGVEVKYAEIQADFIAGGLMNYTELISSNYTNLLKQCIDVGDFQFYSPNHHGTSKERMNAASEGFRYSFNNNITDLYDYSFYYSHDFLDFNRIGELVYTCDFYNGGVLYIYYGGKVMADNGYGRLMQIGQMVTVPATNPPYYLASLNFTKSGYSDMKIGYANNRYYVHDSMDNLIGSMNEVYK